MRVAVGAVGVGVIGPTVFRVAPGSEAVGVAAVVGALDVPAGVIGTALFVIALGAPVGAKVRHGASGLAVVAKDIPVGSPGSSPNLLENCTPPTATTPSSGAETAANSSERE